MNCMNCGAFLTDMDLDYCPNCGYNVLIQKKVDYLSKIFIIRDLRRQVSVIFPVRSPV